jgi:PTH2 family peptidyl-tRNA hydrolase
MREVKQYIIVRTDLPMNAGKLAAQAGHAVMKVFFDKFEHTKVVDKVGENPEDVFLFRPSEEEKRWIKGKFTKITKKVKNESQLLKVYEQAKAAKLNVSLVKDAGLYGLEGENYTCIAIGPNYVEDCEPVVGKLRLLTDLKKNDEKKE